MMIAHTQSSVVMPLKGVGGSVNIEVDMVGKYALKSVEGLMKGTFEDGKEGGNKRWEIEGLVERVVRKVLAEKHGA